MINDDSRRGFRHKKTLETMSGIIACRYITKTQVKVLAQSIR